MERSTIEDELMLLVEVKMRTKKVISVVTQPSREKQTSSFFAGSVVVLVCSARHDSELPVLSVCMTRFAA
jgi:hypothetical protein